MKTNLVILLTSITFVFFGASCKKEANPRAVIKVVEYIDTIPVAVNQAKVVIRPATKETVEEEHVVDEGYTNSSGKIEFEFERELVLKATAYKYLKDEYGEIVTNNIGNPIIQKSGYKTVVLQIDHTDNLTIEVK